MSAVWRRSISGVTAVLVGLVMAFQFTGSAYAADEAINETNFPDANFRNYVSTTFDTNSDGILQQAEADTVTEINVTNRSITSLKGVEHFTKLTTLNASNEYYGSNNNQLTAVDLSHNTNLTELDLSYNNELTAVDLKANTKLTKLNLAGNKLTAVDLSHNTNLSKLDLSFNQLTAVNVSANTNLTKLDLTVNKLTAVDLKANTNLTWLNLDDNKLTAVDLKANTNLTELYLSNNKLTAVDLSHNTNLTELGLAFNPLTAVDLKANTNLTWLALSDNQLTAVDLSANTNLTELQLGGNPLTAVDLKANTNLEKLYLDYNELTAVDLSANTKLTRLDLAGNQLTAVDLSHNTKLDYLDLSGNQLTAVDLSANTHLGRDCEFDQSRAVRLPRSSRLVPVNQLSAEFDASKVRNLRGATIVDGQLKVDEGASKVTYNYDTNNSRYRLMPVTLRVMVAQVYTVSFDMGGHGAQVAAQSVDEGELASAPANPTAEGWEFKGWYMDNTFATAFDFSAPINADVTVSAKWEKASGQSTTQPTVVKAKKVPKTGGESSFGFAGVGAVVAAGVAAGWLFRRRNS